MASGQWHIEDLTGTKDGVNVDFTLSASPNLQTLLVFHGTPGVTLYRVSSSPATGEYAVSGVDIEVGLAPTALQKLWAQYEEA